MKKARRNSFCVPTLPPLGSRKNTVICADKKTTVRHFLRDVNLDGDLLSIPDPPSPPKRNSRRQSSPALRPLDDISNGKAVQSGAFTGNGKRSRMSLCHVPSPTTEADDNNESVTKESIPSLEEKVPSSDEVEHATTPAVASLESIICFDDEDIIVSSSKRQKRRESMILPGDMAPLPLEETGDYSSDHVERNEKHDDALPTTKKEFSLEPEHHLYATMVASKRPVKPQSIFLPSDIASFQDEVASEVFGHAEKSRTTEAAKGDDSAAEENALVHKLEVDDRALPIKSKRCSKRQSMVLPSDAYLLQDDEASEFFCTLQSLQPKTDELMSVNNVPTNVASMHEEKGYPLAAKGASKSTSTSEKPCTETEIIRNLVREYCSLPLEDRNNSNQAKEIERMTGYSLVPSAAKQQQSQQKRSGVDLNWSGSPRDARPEDMVTKQNESVMAKRELLLKLGAMVDLMDKRKAEDTKEMEASTGCRSQRSRSGKYRYYHLFSNRKISPTEYGELYLATLKQSKVEISRRIQDWLQESNMSVEEIDEQCVKISALVEAVQQPFGNGEDQGSDVSAQDSTLTIMNPRKIEDGRAGSESDMDESPSSDSGFASSTNNVYSPPRVAVKQARDGVQSSDDSESMEEGGKSILSLGDTSLEVETSETPKDAESTNGASELLELLLPSRDETSDDPEIAAAEERLWLEIDAALERYSRQVIAIHEARASG